MDCFDEKSRDCFDEKSRFTYLQWQELYKTQKPYQIFINLPEHVPEIQQTNLVFKSGEDEIIHDIRGCEASYTLDDHGFILCKHQTEIKNWNDAREIESTYLPEMEAFLKKEVDEVDRVFFFDWRIRKHDTLKKEGQSIDLNNKLDHLLPAIHVHVDQSPTAVLKRVTLQLKDDAEFLLKGRIRVINAWRPLRNPVQDWPLALCDGSSVSDADLIPTDHVRRHYAGETLYVLENHNYRWHYIHHQRTEEVWLFKNFDSSDRVRARHCPHASFQHQDIPCDSLPRESIEVRALVFTYPK